MKEFKHIRQYELSELIELDINPFIRFFQYLNYSPICQFDINQSIFSVEENNEILFIAEKIEDKFYIETIKENVYYVLNQLYEQSDIPILVNINNFDKFKFKLREVKRNFSGSEVIGNYLVIPV